MQIYVTNVSPNRPGKQTPLSMPKMDFGKAQEPAPPAIKPKTFLGRPIGKRNATQATPGKQAPLPMPKMNWDEE